MSVIPPFPETQLGLAVAVFCGTLLYEDGATVLAATLAASGRLDLGLGVMAAFSGIWLGDIGLYALGSTFRQVATRSRRLARFLTPEALAKAENWLQKRGSMALVMSRAIPGSRLPLYLASGALRLPLRNFVQITGICSAIWVSTLFAIWRFIPATSSNSGKTLRWLATAAVFVGPWVLRKVLQGTVAKPRTPDLSEPQSSLRPCVP